MRSTSRTSCPRALAPVLLLLFAAAPAFAERVTNTPLLFAVEVGARAAREAQLECTAAARAGERPGLMVRNAGPYEAVLFFANGQEQTLAPGERITLSAEAAALSTHRCVCSCTCSGEGFSQKISFPCDASTGPDTCPSADGSACFVFVGTDLKEGTLSGCKRAYVPVAAEPAEQEPAERP